MKQKRWITAAAAVMILVLAAVIVWKPIYYTYRDHQYYQSAPSDAEQAVMTFAKESGLQYGDYPESIIALLERNPETEAFVLHFPLEKDKQHSVDLSAYENSDGVPLFMQWDPQWGYLTYGSDVVGITGCGPMCLSMAAYYLTGDNAYAPDKMVSFAWKNGYYSPGNGSSWTLISEGGKKLGFQVTELPLVKSKITNCLEAGYPVILAMGPGDFTATGHYIVLAGLQDDAFRVNDPNSRKNSEKLWTYEELEGQIRNIWVIQNP